MKKSLNRKKRKKLAIYNTANEQKLQQNMHKTKFEANDIIYKLSKSATCKAQNLKRAFTSLVEFLRLKHQKLAH